MPTRTVDLGKVVGPAGPNEVSSSTNTALNGVLFGNGSKVGVKTLDTSSLTNDNNHVPTSGVVKSAISAADVFDDSTAAHQGAGYKNSVFRGKNLGAFNATYAAAIADGTFAGMFLGDYFQSSFVRRKQDGGAIDTITVNWRIWGFDLFLHKGNTELTTHHAVILPDQNLGTIRMNSTDTTENGYAGTELRSSGRTTIQNQIVSAFTISSIDHVLTYKDFLSSAVSNGESSAGDWYDCKVEVPSDVMLTGAKHWGTGNDVGLHSILPLAAITQEFVCNRAHFRLRSVSSASNFSTIVAAGNVASWGPASNTNIWFRPFFLLS